MQFLNKHKWKLAWICYGLSIFAFVYFVIEFNEETWFPLILQIFGIALPLVPTLIIFMQSRADSEKAMREQLNHWQELNQREIEAMTTLFQKQIDVITSGTNTQINELKLSTHHQVNTIEANTEKQIDNYVRQTSQIVSELKNNSVLLAEILLRQLEEKLQELHTKLNKARADYDGLNEFQFLRTPEEKQAQLVQQMRYIVSIDNSAKQVQLKCQQIKDFLNKK